MKYVATKWPVTITLELSDDYKNGIETWYDDNVGLSDDIQDLANYIADGLIKAKGYLLAREEAKSKSSSLSDHT